MIEGRKDTVLLRVLNLSNNVLLELVLIEGWTAECIFSQNSTRQFFVSRIGNRGIGKLVITSYGE